MWARNRFGDGTYSYTRHRSSGKLSLIIWIWEDKSCRNPMKHILKIFTLLSAISAFWIGLLQASIFPRSYTFLLPIYLIVLLGCYGLLMVGIGLMQFPTCPQEATLLQQDIAEAKDFLKGKGVDRRRYLLLHAPPFLRETLFNNLISLSFND
ncbi:hypothetical protein Nepgr_017825 [Nepenthes gracilis]|uniref:Dolichol-phosphate mannosyltransferase subunit 3 n=1 Tax=Nepenthes gracilis TaxID=150966 RepID=A0AAD3SSD5_NEPGR|nr:hypothetical protein Nepgr_017825 [Nepenthes gracilis]